MLSYKVTAAEVKKHYRVISVGYAEMQVLLPHGESQAYNSGKYGWNYDVFEASGDYCIVTGYRCPSGPNVIRPSYELVRETEEKARRMRDASDSWSDWRCTRLWLMDEFIDKALKESQPKTAGTRKTDSNGN